MSTSSPAPTSDLPLTTRPAGGTPPLTTSIQGVLEWCQKVAPGEGLAIDVERASSYRYSSRAYLIQVKSSSAGILLLDPLAFQLPQTFRDTLGTHEWILHASRQDLPSLAMLDLTPPSLFDTEVAARLVGLSRVNLGAVAEELLGVRLAKEHSAANWSTRPLPEAWLDYAALDVEFLVQLREQLHERLEAAGKLPWALEEFAFESTFSTPAPLEEPWRRLHGLGQLRHPKQLAVARAMWEHRDARAREADVAPFMIVRDRYLVAMAKAASRGRGEFEAAAPRTLKHRDQWWQIARGARDLPAAHLPARQERSAFPHHKLWARKFPEAHEAYQKVREALVARAEELEMPVENLMSPGHVRHWVWRHFGDEAGRRSRAMDEAEVRAELEGVGARHWQAEQVAPVLVALFSR